MDTLNTHIARGGLLYGQGRFSDAEKEYRSALVAAPERGMSHAMLALCLMHQERFADATREAQEAIRCEPDNELTHRVLGMIHYHRNRYDDALACALEASQLDPFEPEVFSLIASIHIAQRDWRRAVEAAEQGLALEPDHVECQNWRAMALVKLGRREEAGQSIRAALAADPDDPMTHANQGWALLHEGKHKEALEHFREALRLDPTLEWARLGIVEALKSRNPVYRILLKYFLWISTLSSGGRWGVMIGGYMAYRGLSRIAQQAPEARVWVWPILGLYLAFVAMTWLGNPLFNLMLRLNRFGRLALSRNQVVASNWAGALVLGAVVCLGAGIFLNTAALLGALACAVMIMPVSAVFDADPGWPRKTMVVFSAALATIAVAVLAMVGLEEAGYALPKGLFSTLLLAFILGVILSPWVSNAMIMQTPKR